VFAVTANNTVEVYYFCCRYIIVNLLFCFVLIVRLLIYWDYCFVIRKLVQELLTHNFVTV